MLRVIFAALMCITMAASVLAQQPVSWKACGWGGGGFYWSCAFDPTNDGVIYMGGDVIGVYKTTDHGQHWQLANNGLAGYEVLCLAVDPKTPDTVYAATSGGVCRSTDAAGHWTLLPETAKLKMIPVKGKSVRALCVDPADSNILYFGTPDGRILRSADAGQTWAQINRIDGGSVASVAVSPDAKRTLYAATSDGLLMVDSAGKSARTLAEGNCMALTLSPDGKTLYAAMAKKGVQKSTDGGATWSPAATGLASDADIVDIAMNPQNPNEVYCIGTIGWGGGFYRTEDGGAKWSPVGRLKRSALDPTLPEEEGSSATLPLSNPRNLAVNPKNGNELMVAANWRPAYSADGGKTWEERANGADISCVFDVQFNGPRTYVTCMDEGLFVSPDQGATWQQLVPKKWGKEVSGHQWRVLVWKDGQEILSTNSPWDTQINQVQRSLDGGKTFIPVRDGLPTYVPKANTMWEKSYPRAIASHPSNPYTIYMGMDGDADAKGSGGGIFVSKDGGWHWKQMANQPACRRVFFALAIDPTNASRIFWGGCGEGGGLYRSDDAGESWKRVFDKETWVFNVHVAADGTIYCPGKQLWKSTDHGDTWQQVTHLKDGEITALESDPKNPSRVWFAVNTWDSRAFGGIYESTDAGKSWSEITGDIANRKPLVLRYNPQTKELWAAGPALFRTTR